MRLRFRKSLAVVLAIVLMVVPLFTGTVQAADPVQAVLNAGYNFRTGPHLSSSKIAFLDKGQVMTILDTVTGDNVSPYGNLWYYISTVIDGTEKTGYIIKSSDVQVIYSTFEQQLATFPASYQDKLISLHNQHPNWSFTALKIDYDWDYVLDKQEGKNAVASSKAISQRSLLASTVNGGYGPSYNPLEDTYYNKDGAGYNYASRQTIGYYMDARNFLTDSKIFMFENLSARTGQTEAGVEAILNGTFMSNAQVPTMSGKTYAQLILDAAQYANCSAYFIAARIRQEIGVTESKSVTGTFTFNGVDYSGYYNFFNIGASDSSVSGQNIANALTFAKGTNSDSSYLLPWDSREKAIKGGAKYVADKYINAGQDTVYLQKFNVRPGASFCSHQYMSSVHAPSNDSSNVYSSYVNLGAINNSFEFVIPVFNNMPSSPVELATETRSANNYLSNLSLSSGTLSPGFAYTTNGTYQATVSESTSNVTLTGHKASLTSSVSIGSDLKLSSAANTRDFTIAVNLNYGQNSVPLTITSETGVANTYNINIIREQPAQPVTVTFDSTGGTTVGSKTATYNTAITAPTDPTRTGYTFAGWYTAASGGAKVEFPYTVTENITLYAQWTANNYTVTFNSNGGTAVDSKTAEYNTAITAPTDPTRTGYAFAGWYTAASEGAKIEFPYTVTDNITLHAQWMVNNYTVTFNSNGGTAVDSKTAEYNTAITAPTDPTRTGYAFTGWYTAASGGVKITFPYTVTDNATLFAQWNPIVSKGDANGDGLIRFEDITLLSRYIAGWKITVVEYALDVNSDGDIDFRDITLLSRYLAGWNVVLG